MTTKEKLQSDRAEQAHLGPAKPVAVKPDVKNEAAAVGTSRDPGDALEQGDDAEQSAHEISNQNYAGYFPRAIAFSLDVICPAAVAFSLLLIDYVLGYRLWYVIASCVMLAVIVVYVVWNRVWEQGRTGRTVGKRAVSIIVVHGNGGRPLGWRRAACREAAHAVDTCVVLLGWFRPLWDTRSQTLADRFAHTVVLVDDAEQRGNRNQVRVLASLVVLIVALGALAGTAYFSQYRPDQQTAEAEQTIQQVASDATTALLSYSATSAESQLKSASSLLTGDFRDYYTEFTQKVVVPAATEKNVNTQAKVVGVAIERVSPESAALLVMVDQTTTTSDSPTPTASQSAVKVELSKLDGHWLVSAFNPVL